MEFFELEWLEMIHKTRVGGKAQPPRLFDRLFACTPYSKHSTTQEHFTCKYFKTKRTLYNIQNIKNTLPVKTIVVVASIEELNFLISLLAFVVMVN